MSGMRKTTRADEDKRDSMSEKDVREAIEQIEGTIDEVGEFISGSHEYQTRCSLIDPILTSLGWAISDVNQVEVEYETDWGRVDYALLESPDGEPAIAVEAKTLWTNLETAAIQRQILSYAEGSATKDGESTLNGPN